MNTSKNIHVRAENPGIIKTLPHRFARGQLEKFFGYDGKPCFHRYYFTLGRGRPKRDVSQLYFTHRGKIIGHFEIAEIVQNVGQLPLLTTLDGKPSEWQIKLDAWVAVCYPPFHRETEPLFYAGFRGFRYFELDSYRSTLDAKIRI